MVKITFHKFNMGDVEELELYAAYPIQQWLQTEKGTWVQTHCPDLMWQTVANPHTYGYTIILRGSLTDKDATEYFLRWSNE